MFEGNTARPFWEHWGFREAETYIDEDGFARYGDTSYKTYKYDRKVRRMTRIVTLKPPSCLHGWQIKDPTKRCTSGWMSNQYKKGIHMHVDAVPVPKRSR